MLATTKVLYHNQPQFDSYFAREMKCDCSSFSVFMSFVKEMPNGEVDVSMILSAECFNRWLSSRSFPPKNAEESFRKALTSHCRGIDGRKAFPPKVEAELLKELRKKKIWDCFIGTGLNIGKRGLQLKGFWESKSALPAAASSTSNHNKRKRMDETIKTEFDAHANESQPNRPRKDIELPLLPEVDFSFGKTIKTENPGETFDPREDFLDVLYETWM